MQYRILVIDANYLAHMKFSNNGALYGGFLWKLLDLRDEWKPGTIYLVWDDPRGVGRRRRMHAGYKAQRPPKAQGFADQVADLRQVLSWMGYTQFDSAFGEGDDCAATISRQWPGPQLLWTADKDWLQLIGSKTHILRAGCGGKPDVLATEENCKQATGFSPAEWTDYLTLAGDSVDGITGIPGVGPTWAKRIIEGVPDVVNLLLAADQDDKIRELSAAADEAKLGKYVELAIKHREDVAVSRQLVKLYNVEMEIQAPEPDLDMIEVWMSAKELEHIWRRL